MSIRYNVLNLPDTIQFSNGHQITNRYTADGIKHMSTYHTALTTVAIPLGSVCQWVNNPQLVERTRTYYCGNAEYEESGTGIASLQRIGFGNGYIRNNTYYYTITDYLGNISSVWNGTSNVVEQQTTYYPSGLPHRTSTNANLQRYKYNGKELITNHGYDQYDYHARGYYPAIMRFTSVDPKAHLMPSWSPYSFCFNNPLKFIDPTGEIPTPVEGARIAGHIYDGKIGDVLEGGWRLDKVYTSKENSAYRSGLYSRTVDGVTEYAMANAGTYFENSKRGRGSMSEDVEQPFGGSENMRVSIATAKKVSEQIGDKELTFVGHSKGGAEAAGNALATNRNALLYNPAAINAEAYGLDTKSYTGADKNGMTAFIVKGDMLNSFINQFFAKPIDKAVYLPQQSKNPVTNHLIDTMIKALQQYYKTNAQK